MRIIKFTDLFHDQVLHLMIHKLLILYNPTEFCGHRKKDLNCLLVLYVKNIGVVLDGHICSVDKNGSLKFDIGRCGFVWMDFFLLDQENKRLLAYHPISSIIMAKDSKEAPAERQYPIVQEAIYKAFDQVVEIAYSTLFHKELQQGNKL